MKHSRFIFLLITQFILISFVTAQNYRWQQSVSYKINFDLNNENHHFAGDEELLYTNNSPDTLKKLFFHLYLNAFQPNSEMDVRSRWIADPDGRVKDRISKLKPDEIGIQSIKTIRVNGKKQDFIIEGTILEVSLSSPILPNKVTKINLDFEGQVPVQIRRTGRNNAEGIDYSMSQWYPKLCEYDEQGWHSNPYVAREFYGVWGNFEVKINIDKKYILAATGYLQNPKEVGFDDPNRLQSIKKDKIEWIYKAENVHDFTWAADPEFTHTERKTNFGTNLHCFFKKTETNKDSWEKLPAIMDEAMSYANQKFGKYPYKDYSFVQAGDGGMEYMMLTFVTGERPLSSLIGVCAHEMMHSWYQGQLASNESLYPWMDEGFTDYAETSIMEHLKSKKIIDGEISKYPYDGSISTYIKLAKSGKEEPMTTHSDHYQTNFAYSIASYVKGDLFLHQLNYLIGNQPFNSGLLRYYNEWKGRHPNPNDCIRVFEKESNLELDWYKEYWVNTTNTIDYYLKNVQYYERKETKIQLERLGKMPMPLEIQVTLKDSSRVMIYVPIDLMRGTKHFDKSTKYEVAKVWQWTDTKYDLIIPYRFKQIVKIEIDPNHGMADINRENNVLNIILDENDQNDLKD